VKPQTRDRLLLPIVLPVVILLVIIGVLFGFSRILLNVTATSATVVAFIVAAGIVVTAAVAAGRPMVRGSTVAAMAGVVAGVAMLSGGVALAVLAGGEGGGEEPGGPSGGGVVTLAAQNIAFDPNQLSVPAGEPFTLAFTNNDAGVQHNVDIFEKEGFSGDPLFEGDLVTGVADVDYDVPALDAGTYFFRCIVHPTMTGTIEAAEGGGGGEPGGGGGVTVVAQNISFDTNEIDLPPDAPSTITFDNQDPGVQHNIAIYEDDSLSKSLFQGDLVTGPGQAEYAVPALSAGEYYFHCDVHPNMNGTVVVGGDGAPGPSGGPGASGPSGDGGSSGPSGGATGATSAATGDSGGGGSGAAESSTVTAQNIAFDTPTISLPAGAETTLTFDNEDPGVQHYIAIYGDDTLAENLFRGDLVTGPETVDYSIPALDAGEYYFHCDVHPNMSGTVTVA